MREWLVDTFGLWADLGPFIFTLGLIVLLLVRAIRAHMRPLQLMRWALPLVLAYELYVIWLFEEPLLREAARTLIVFGGVVALAFFMESKVPR